jgi:hypothetical protein
MAMFTDGVKQGGSYYHVSLGAVDLLSRQTMVDQSWPCCGVREVCVPQFFLAGLEASFKPFPSFSWATICFTDRNILWFATPRLQQQCYHGSVVF